MLRFNTADSGIDAPGVQPQAIERVGVIGAGVMGCAIAATNLSRNLPVTMSDADADALSRSSRIIPPLAADMADSETPDRATQPAPVLAKSEQDFASCDLIIESIVETLEVKRKVLQRVEPHLSDSVVIGSNTSTIPIAQLARGLAAPDRLCGIHFCNPVRYRKLVEVVRGPQTSDQTIATAVAYAKKLGKLPIVVRDNPGFLVNRILFPYLSAALELLSEGVDARQIERVAISFGMQLGPLGLLDLIGVDTAFYAGRSMYDTFRDRIVASPILPALFKAGRLGQKKGIGFYVYDPNRPQPEIDDSLSRYVEQYIRQRYSLSDEQVEIRLLVPMLLEATRALEEGLVRDPRDIDLATIFGLGFPAARGGLLFWADQVGAPAILALLEPLKRLGKRAAPTTLLQQMAAEDMRFHGVE
jgi:3-hydroxyacyl-CoA dehydrogenase/enoyl-CoA hydratase/3-hydroxybutyryl-CoA epimerase/3-hydroxyacyl-CoA dehydrogenase/enoyl-CoA hydratase/3-hydroxybutyryl-CoA epimerase/enoyl-CoA isomerase